MKKNILILVSIIALFFISNFTSYSQRYRPYGGTFTPKGEFKMLVVFVGYGDNDTLLQLDNWHKDSAFPNEIYNNKTFYSNYSEFNNYLKQNMYINILI